MTSKTLVLDSRTSETSINMLKSMGYNIVKIPTNSDFDKPISAHPDMFMTRIGNKIFIDSTVIDLFTITSDFVVCNREVETDAVIKYPYDISYNCVNVGKYLICNKAYAHKSIIEFAENNKITIVDVKQGYAKCSTCVVSDNAIITEDKSISEAAIIAGIDVLKIEKGYVSLNGYDYGFIGGCCGLIERNLLAFNGDITKHPDYQKIFEFCSKYNVSMISLNGENLYDIGSVIRI